MPKTTPKKSKSWHCGRRGCAMSRAAHARQVAYLTETVGPRAGDDFASAHPDPEQS